MLLNSTPITSTSSLSGVGAYVHNAAKVVRSASRLVVDLPPAIRIGLAFSLAKNASALSLTGALARAWLARPMVPGQALRNRQAASVVDEWAGQIAVDFTVVDTSSTAGEIPQTSLVLPVHAGLDNRRWVDTITAVDYTSAPGREEVGVVDGAHEIVWFNPDGASQLIVEGKAPADSGLSVWMTYQ